MNIVNAVLDLQLQSTFWQPSETPFQRATEHSLTFSNDVAHAVNPQDAGLDEELIYFKLLIAHS